MRKFAVIQLLAVWGVVSFMISGSAVGASFVQVETCDDPASAYTVQPGDKLFEIGMAYGDFRFWEAIYIANADLIDNPDIIYPGQQLEIPYPIYTFKNSGLYFSDLFPDAFCSNRSIPVSSVNWARLAVFERSDVLDNPSGDQNFAENMDQGSSAFEDSLKIAEFRGLFNSVVEADKKQQERSGNAGGNRGQQQDSVQQQTERQIMLEIDGMVLDETRSKVGRDFYHVFYTNWQQPPDTHNFSIRIAEQPSPSLGTIIYVEVNDTETFRMRLQPRYDFIQQAGKYAVRQTYSYLQNNDHRLQIY